MRYKFGVLFAFLNSVTLGIVGIIDKIGVASSINPLLFSTQSITFALLFSIAISVVFFKKDFLLNFKKVSFISWRHIFFVGIFGSGLFILFRFLGLTQSTGTFATLSQVITTSSTALLAAIFLKERLSKSFWMLFTIIIISVYFVSVGRFALTSLQQGDMFIVIGALFLASGNIFSQLAVKTVSPIILTVGRLFFGAIFLLLINLFLLQNFTHLFRINTWAIVSGLFWAFLIIIFNLALKRLGITFTLSIIMTAPVYTMILEYIILKHIFNPLQITAATVVIMSGILLVYLKNK